VLPDLRRQNRSQAAAANPRTGPGRTRRIRATSATTNLRVGSSQNAIRVALSESLELLDTLERGVRIAYHVIQPQGFAHRA
jgi:hypothetical protein